MKRISVIGCPGAGKTEFSKQLNKKVSLPLVHLDRIYHDLNFPYQSDKELWRKRVRELVKSKEWLIDGNYKSTFDIRLPESDTIILLDYPTYICIWRAIKRRIRFNDHVRPDMPETWREKLSWDFFVFIIRFNHNHAARMRIQVEEYAAAKRVIILKTPKQAENFLSEFSQTQ